MRRKRMDTEMCTLLATRMGKDLGMMMYLIPNTEIGEKERVMLEDDDYYGKGLVALNLIPGDNVYQNQKGVDIAYGEYEEKFGEELADGWDVGKWREWEMEEAGKMEGDGHGKCRVNHVYYKILYDVKDQV